MHFSIDALQAFAIAAEQGSFSAAARHLNKRQSTISEAIANLEIDLGLTLFDRSGRQPTLTAAGKHLLRHARRALEAQDTFQQQANLLLNSQETCLTLVLSDTYQSQRLQQLCQELAKRHPYLELEGLLGEGGDVIELIQSGRGHLGIISEQSGYPSEIGKRSLPHAVEFGLYVADVHPLAAQACVTELMLAEHRELRLNTYGNSHLVTGGPQFWSAPSYMMLLNMAWLGVGWAALPRWLVEMYGNGKLYELKAPGWPRTQRVDLIWSQRHKLGPIARWVIEQLAMP